MGATKIIFMAKNSTTTTNKQTNKKRKKRGGKIENNWERHAFIVPYPGLGALLTPWRNHSWQWRVWVTWSTHKTPRLPKCTLKCVLLENSTEILSQGICLKFINQKKDWKRLFFGENSVWKLPKQQICW